MELELTRISNEFEGKVAMITGSARGIGQATAVAFARRGADVVVLDMDERADETLSYIERLGCRGVYVQTDVTDSRSVQEAVRRTIETFGRLDFAHNNAGIRAVANVADLPEETWRKVIEVNLTGVFLGMKYQIPEILKTGGAIVNTASVFGIAAVPGRSAYVASKAGVIGLTKTAASEYAEQGIRINAVAPGLIMTEAAMATLQEGTGADAVIARTPRRKPGTPSDIAEAVVWLCGPYSVNVNGAVLPVDGGWSAV